MACHGFINGNPHKNQKVGICFQKWEPTRKMKTFKCLHGGILPQGFIDGNPHKNQKSGTWFPERESTEKYNHLNLSIGARRFTKSSMGTRIKIKRLEYGFTNKNPHKNKNI